MFLKEKQYYVNDCKRQSGRYVISESRCIVTISVWDVCPIIAHSQNGGFVTFYTSRSRCIVNISVWEVCPIIAHSQNGGFVTFYISGSRCIVTISVWEVCPIIAHSKMADS